jgi:hypothetical protein
MRVRLASSLTVSRPRSETVRLDQQALRRA